MSDNKYYEYLEKSISGEIKLREEVEKKRMAEIIIYLNNGDKRRHVFFPSTLRVKEKTISFEGKNITGKRFVTVYAVSQIVGYTVEKMEDEYDN